MSKNFVERFKEEESECRFWTINKKIGAVVAALSLAIILVNTTGCTQKEQDVVNSTPAELPQETVKVGNDGVNAAIAPDDVINSVRPENSQGAMVAMTIDDTGREDPFLPISERSEVKAKPKLNYDLLPPPESITFDTTAADVIATKVSGIMYDKYNPSAILNISGADYLVRTGDVINNYKVLSIAKDYVTVQNGANVYKAGVGELFNGDGLNFNTVSNLNNKFGGNKN